MSADDLTDAIFKLPNKILYKLLSTLPNVAQLGEISLEGLNNNENDKMMPFHQQNVSGK